MDYKYKFQNLCNWIIENGGQVNHKISIEETPHGRSIKSIDVIDTDEVLFNIPKNLLLNLSNIDLQIEGDISEKCSTVIALLYEMKREESFWQPYIDIFPPMKELETHPIILNLVGKFPTISNTINNNLILSQQDLSYTIEFITKNNLIQEILIEEIIWAYVIVSTRMWTKFGLVPLADMFQHKNDSEIFLKEYDEDFVGMVNNAAINSDQTIFDNYNIKDDIQLFTNWGFIDYTKECFINLYFENIENLEDFEDKTFLSINNFPPQNFYLDRIKMLNREDIKSKLYLKPLSNDLEIKVAESLIERIKKLEINEEIVELKKTVKKYNRSSIESQIIDLMKKIEILLEVNIKYLEDYSNGLQIRKS